MMKKTIIILSTLVFIASSYGQETKKEKFFDIPLEKTNIAASNCNSNGLYGKFPLQEKWTLISFRRNIITIVETKRYGYDWVGNPSTLFVSQEEEEERIWFDFDMAFKGVYTEADIKILSPVAENNDEIVNLIKRYLADDEFFKQKEMTGIKLYSFTTNENKFWIAYYTFLQKDFIGLNNRTVVFGVTPDNDVVFLADHCMFESPTPIYILQLKNDFYLYPNNIYCGEEGAIGIRYLYKLTTGFEKVFGDSIICD